MKYLLDTTTISDVLRRQPQVIDNLRKVSPKDIYISCISKYEIEYGFAKNPKYRKKYGDTLQELYRLTNDIGLTTEIALQAALIANNLKEKGKPIGVPDMFIAATALSKKLTVVTSNTKHFERVDICIEDWRN